MMSEKKGYFALVLHAHLPYVLYHGRWPHGTDWLCEAVAECYLPLLNAFEKLIFENVNFRVTINLSPVLCEQLASSGFRQEFKSYIESKIDAARKDMEYFSKRGFQQREKLARMWINFYENVWNDFDNRYGGNILSAFAKLWSAGYIEVLTSAATHGYLPLILDDRCVRAQIEVGKQTTQKRLNKVPSGIWLPECAYRPSYEWAPPINGFNEPKRRAGIEEILSDMGISHFVVDSHLLEGGKAIGIYLERFEALRLLYERWSKDEISKKVDSPKSVYKPYFVVGPTGKGAIAFGRHPKTSLQVWSAKHGYPGDFDYLEFHKKSFPGGLRYWRITDALGDLASKKEYVPSWADGKVVSHARHFVGLLNDVVLEAPDDAIVVSPYDAELFGHWWFEGPKWLCEIYRQLNSQSLVRPITLSEYAELFPPKEVLVLPEGSWGEGGHHWIWLNQDTEWTWKLVYSAEKKMLELAARISEDDELAVRILNQMGRELLLIESSDWQFLISTWTARDYAEARINLHYENFLKLVEILEKKLSKLELSEDDVAFLQECERHDGIFPDISFKSWL